MDTKKVSLTINQTNYQRLSDYCKRYGVSQRHMLHLLLDDAIENDRYISIFGKRHKMSHISDTVIDRPKDIKIPHKIEEEDDKNILSDISIDTSISEADEIIEALKDEFNIKINDNSMDKKDPIITPQYTPEKDNNEVHEDSENDFENILG